MKQNPPHRFPARVLQFSGVYGILSLIPMYFTEISFGKDFPPLISHPEFYYGFIGVALAWQVAFFIMAADPVRFGPMLIPAALEKISFGVAALVLFFQSRLPQPLLFSGLVDLALGALFVVAYQKIGYVQTSLEI